MKEMLKRWGGALLDPFAVQIYFIVCSFCVEIPLLMAGFAWWKKVGLLWAALVIVYDLLTRRRCLKARFATAAFCLLAAYAVTLVGVRLHYPAAFQESYLDWMCSAVALLILYPPSTDERAQGLRRLSALNWLLIVLTTAVALIGLAMFCVQVGGYFYSPITDYDYPIGFVAKRLTGLYRNAIYPTAFIGVMAAVIEWVRLRSRRVGCRVALALCTAVNLLHIVLSNSRGIVYALALFAAGMALLLLRRLLRQKAAERSVWVSLRGWMVGALAAAVALVVVIEAVPLVRGACAYVPAKVQQVTGVVESPFPSRPSRFGSSDGETELLDPDEPIDFDRDSSESNGVLTGRPIIWRQGVSFFLERPWFGYGPSALKKEIRLSETSTEKLSHFHNIFLQSLVSVGGVGSLFFFLLLLGAAWRVLRYLLLKTDAEHYAVLAGLGCMLAALLFVNMADTTIFFLSKNSEFVFWTYLGYAFLLMDEKPYRMDAPLRFLDARLPRFQSRETKG